MGNVQSDKMNENSNDGERDEEAAAINVSNSAKNASANGNDDNENKRPFFLEKILQDMFHPSSPRDEPEPVIRPPKHMLWGCASPEEHYDKIKDVCTKAPFLKGEEGLRELGFEFRMVHHPETCVCDDNCLALDDGMDNDALMMDDTLGQQEEYMVPICVPLKEHKAQGLERSMTDLVESTIDRLSHQEDMVDFPDDEKASMPPKKASNVSLFSLATHYTASTTASSNQPPSAISYHGGSEEETTCTMRLHHIPSGGTLVTPENHQDFIAHGPMYDEIARLCMEVAQNVMVKEGDLHWVSICDARGIEALVSKSKSRKILLIVTGKGQVRAGIFSRRHLMTTGVESSTALPLIREARERDMEIVMLDPNAKGHRMGMEVVEASLEKLFFDREQDEEIYVVAHSMAGAQLVRFLHKHESSGSDAVSSSTSVPLSESDGNDVAAPCSSDKETQSFLRKIKAVAFTDSNHNINWTKNTPSVTNLLVGPSCLYIKSHKVHDEPKSLGEQHHHCDFWKHRFGDIRTLWAGTHEHALTNYTARYHIWDHFDEFLHPEGAGGDGYEEDEFQTYYGAEGLIE